MKKTAIIILICLAPVLAFFGFAGNKDTAPRQEDYVYVGGDLRGNNAARLFSAQKIEGIQSGFELRQCVYSGDSVAIAAARKEGSETDCIFYSLATETTQLEKIAELKAAELCNIDSAPEDDLLAFTKSEPHSAGRILELSPSGTLSELDLDSYPQAAALKPTQAWRLSRGYLLACPEGLYSFDLEDGSVSRVFDSSENICSIFRDKSGALFFSTGSLSPASGESESRLYRLREDNVPELIVEKDCLVSFFPAAGGFCLLSDEGRRDKLYKLDISTGEEIGFAYTGNLPATGSFLFAGDDRLLFWNLELPLGIARPALPGEQRIITIAGWLPDNESAQSFQEYYTARDGLLQKAIDYAVLSDESYLPCYCQYQGERGLQELEAALAEGCTPDILDTTWLTPGSCSKYLQDLRPLLTDTALESGLLPDLSETGTAFEFTPGFIPAATYLDAPYPTGIMPRDKFTRLAAPLLNTMLMNDAKADSAAELIAYALTLPESMTLAETSSTAALSLNGQCMLLSGPVSWEQISGKLWDGLDIAALPVFKLGICSDVDGEKLSACIDFFDFCLTQGECAFLYDRVGASLKSLGQDHACFRELYLSPDFASALDNLIKNCPAPDVAAEMLRDYSLRVQGDYEYKTNGDGTVTITRYLGSGGDVTIPTELDGMAVTAIGYTAEDFAGAFQGSGVGSVVIPEGVTDILDNAFYDCAALKTVTVPASVRVIWNCAFCGCTSLESIYFEGDAPEFAHYVFESAKQPTLYHREGASSWTDPFYGCTTAVY